MLCEYCGAKMPEGAGFCAGCGAKAGPAPRTYAAAPARPPACSLPPEREPLSVGQYIVMFLLMCIPLANFIMPLVWAFGPSVNLNKKNFARAFLTLGVVTLLIWIVAWLSIGGALGRMLGIH